MEKPKKISSEFKLPKIVYAEAAVRPTREPERMGGFSLFEMSDIITTENVADFYSDSQSVRSAVQRLKSEGFNVLFVGQTSISIAGSPKLFERVFKIKIMPDERPAIKEFGVEATATFLDVPETKISGFIETSKSPFAEILTGVSINEPVYYFADPFPPHKEYWYLDVPADVSLGLNADRAHRAGYTGKGIKVVMIDSGWYRHPFFVERKYHANNVVLGPAATNPDHDEHGHGTGESANIFSISPDVQFTMVKLNFVNSVGAFNAAIALKPDIISCSWGKSKPQGPLSADDQALAAAIANAVNLGITVVFSAGNGHWGFPGQHPDVISAGGVYMRSDQSFEATPYASGFSSNIYPGRNCPDVCGLVGLPPRAQYIMLPVEDNNYLDNNCSGGNHPNGDETKPDDGWAAFSGTSAAAPQLAGVCALMKQACRRLTPASLRSILKKTARDVTTGNCSQGHAAGPGPDLATGHGLVDAFRAVLIARLRCIIIIPTPIPIPGPIPYPIPTQPIPTPIPAPSESQYSEEELQDLEDLILEISK